jgi:hypothetical protein
LHGLQGGQLLQNKLNKKKKLKGDESTMSEQLRREGFEHYEKLPKIIHAKQMDKDFEVETMEGTMKGKKGDYLIVGVEGERYPCNEEVFKKSYKESK